MTISDVRIKLAEPKPGDNLRGFAAITFDDAFVVRELKIIEARGKMFVSMPDRKLTDHCPKCNGRNVFAAAWCSRCGGKLGQYHGDGHMHADIAHPINAECRRLIDDAVLGAYREEREAVAGGCVPADRIEHVVTGGLAWGPPEAEHLAVCGRCRGHAESLARRMSA